MNATSNETSPTCPLSRGRTMNLYFMEHRAKLLDIAAFLDRLDRSQPSFPEPLDDVRLAAIHDALAILGDGQPERVRRILELLSDPTLEPAPKAGEKGALGVWPQRQPASASSTSSSSTSR